MENFVRKHYIISCLIFVLLWMITNNYILQKCQLGRFELPDFIQKIKDPLLIAVFVVTIDFLILDLKKKYYLGICGDVTLYHNIDIQQLPEQIASQIYDLEGIWHKRITSGDDIIAYSYLEEFFNKLNVNHVIDSIRNRDDRNINIVKIGMNNQIFYEVNRHLNLRFRNGHRVVDIRNVKGIGSRIINCTNPCYIVKSYSNDENIVLQLAGINESSTQGGAKFLAVSLKEINKKIDLKIRVFHLLTMYFSKVDLCIIIDVDLLNNNICKLVGIWCKKDEVMQELYIDRQYRYQNHRLRYLRRSRYISRLFQYRRRTYVLHLGRIRRY